MPTKTLYIDGATGVMMISDYGTSLNALASPSNYLPNLNFHSSLAYLSVKQTMFLSSITYPAQGLDSYYWDDGQKGGC